MNVKRKLYTIGFETFIDFYYQRSAKSPENLKKAILSDKSENWTESSRTTKANAINAIFREGFEFEALELITKSKRRDKQEARDKAIEILQKEIDNFNQIGEFAHQTKDHEGIRLSTYRKTQTIFRRNLEKAFGEKCAVSGIDKSYLLTASHIIPWSESTDEEKISIDNGLLLTPVYDQLFDRYFIGFDAEGNIHFSPRLSEEDIKLFLDLGVDKRAQLSINISKKMQGNLKKHLAIVLEK